MYMKTNEVISNRRSKREMGWPQRPLWFYPLDHCNPPGGGPSERNSALHIGWSGDPQPPRVEVEGKSPAGEPQQPIKMLKMKVEPVMCMKSKGHVTIYPTQKMTFVPGWTPPFTEMHEF